MKANDDGLVDEKFKIQHIPSLLKDTYKAWMADDPYRLSAIIAYYAILSLPGLLVIIINLVGSFWGYEIVQGQLTNEISLALGKDAAESIREMMIDTQNDDKNLIATIIGIATLVFGATGVFYHLQISLNQVWELSTGKSLTIIQMVKKRILSFAFILAIGFLLLVSFMITTLISTLTKYIKSFFPDIVVYIAFLMDFIISVGIITILFALIFKFLPDVLIKWKSVWTGAFITGILFVVGKLILGFYFTKADPGSTYGAAGTIVLILLWVSYSCLILFFGAEFTWVYSKRYGIGIRPSYKELE